MSETNYLLFPHTVPPETELRHLAILLPQLTMLQICRRPAMPQWAQGIVEARPVITAEQANQTQLMLREYRNFASLVGDGSVLASMGRSSAEDIWRESRFRIQSHLKGKDWNKAIDVNLLAAVEASVFMEMAGELDLQGMELRQGIAQTENLEREFLDIVGIGGEEADKEDALEVADWRLSSEDNYMNFLLAKRLGFWLRLYLGAAREEMPVFVTVTSEVLTEIVDPLVNIGDLANDPAFVIFRTTLAPLPALNTLSDEQFGKTLADLRDSDVMRSYWGLMGRVIDNPEDVDGIEELKKCSAQLHDLLAGHGAEQNSSGQGPSRLSIIACQDLTIGNLWKRFDKSGSETMASSPVLDKPVMVVLYEKGPVG